MSLQICVQISLFLLFRAIPLMLSLVISLMLSMRIADGLHLFSWGVYLPLQHWCLETMFFSYLVACPTYSSFFLPMYDKCWRVSTSPQVCSYLPFHFLPYSQESSGEPHFNHIDGYIQQRTCPTLYDGVGEGFWKKEGGVKWHTTVGEIALLRFRQTHMIGYWHREKVRLYEWL